MGRLEKRGWLRRKPDPSDGRYTLAILGDEGWTKVVEAAPGHVEAVRGLVFDPLTKAQVRQLGRSPAGSCALSTRGMGVFVAARGAEPGEPPVP